MAQIMSTWSYKLLPDKLSVKVYCLESNDLVIFQLHSGVISIFSIKSLKYIILTMLQLKLVYIETHLRILQLSHTACTLLQLTMQHARNYLQGSEGMASAFLSFRHYRR